MTMMNKPRYVVQWDEQPVHFCRTMCSLLESQTLVDMTVISSSYSLKVHKCVMAASSPYLRQQLQREPTIDKVVLNGIKHSVLKAVVEFIYCGETSVYEDSIQELIAVANMLELRGLRAVLPHKLGAPIGGGDDELTAATLDAAVPIKPPAFYCRGERVSGPNYSAAGDDDDKLHVVDEAHVALAKEEAASRFALQMLQKDLTSNLFVIEDACTEATVETSLSVPGHEVREAQQPSATTTSSSVHYVHDVLQTTDEPPMTLKQLVAETVAEPDCYPDQPPPYASFIIDKQALEAAVAAAPLKRRRGRPRKVKLEEAPPHLLDLPHLLADLSRDDVTSLKEEAGDRTEDELRDEDDEHATPPPLRKTCTRSCSRTPASPRPPSQTPPQTLLTDVNPGASNVM